MDFEAQSKKHGFEIKVRSSNECVDVADYFILKKTEKEILPDDKRFQKLLGFFGVKELPAVWTIDEWLQAVQSRKPELYSDCLKVVEFYKRPNKAVTNRDSQLRSIIQLGLYDSRADDWASWIAGIAGEYDILLVLDGTKDTSDVKELGTLIFKAETMQEAHIRSVVSRERRGFLERADREFLTDPFEKGIKFAKNKIAFYTAVNEKDAVKAEAVLLELQGLSPDRLDELLQMKTALDAIT